MLKSSLHDFSDAYILVKELIRIREAWPDAVARHYEKNKQGSKQIAKGILVIAL